MPVGLADKKKSAPETVRFFVSGPRDSKVYEPDLLLF
jgi:hypothetical protein